MLTDTRARTYDEMVDALAAEGLPQLQDTLAGLTAVSDFEAVLTWAVGVTSRAPFAVTTLSDPPRLVIDIASAG